MTYLAFSDPRTFHAAAVVNSALRTPWPMFGPHPMDDNSMALAPCAGIRLDTCPDVMLRLEGAMMRRPGFG